MDVVAGIDGLAAEHGRLFVVVGVFDGLHRGHRFLLSRLRRVARSLGARPTVLTFDAHPDEIIVGAAPPLLCDPDERLARLASAGVDVAIVQHFDAALRTTPYDAFVRAIEERVELAGFLMTPDAAFGYERRGTPAALAELGARSGFEVVVQPPFEVDGRPVRSGTIRDAIRDGDLDRARRLLGRPVAVTGSAHGPLVDFPIPVALPPAGRYRATVEPGWTRDGRVSAPSARVVTVVGDRVEIPDDGRSSGRRARIAFGRRLPERAEPAILRRSQK